MEATHSSSDAFVGTDVHKCYQCGKCTAGCPVAERMDVMPNQVIRLVQLGQLDRAMRCLSIWTCLSCQTCTARCPQAVDCATIIDVVRQQAAANGIIPEEQQRIYLFQRAFLDNVRKFGRVNEVELIRVFKMRSLFSDYDVISAMKDGMKDLPLAFKLRQRGKLHLRGEKARDTEVVRRIFDRCQTTPTNQEA